VKRRRDTSSTSSSARWTSPEQVKKARQGLNPQQLHFCCCLLNSIINIASNNPSLYKGLRLHFDGHKDRKNKISYMAYLFWNLPIILASPSWYKKFIKEIRELSTNANNYKIDSVGSKYLGYIRIILNAQKIETLIENYLIRYSTKSQVESNLSDNIIIQMKNVLYEYIDTELKKEVESYLSDSENVVGPNYTEIKNIFIEELHSKYKKIRKILSNKLKSNFLDEMIKKLKSELKQDEKKFAKNKKDGFYFKNEVDHKSQILTSLLNNIENISRSTVNLCRVVERGKSCTSTNTHGSPDKRLF